ncbi:TPA: hypothetical protein ACTYOU_003827 [Enterobacter hormaechei]|uniref:hypothetical protein n=1 Tax=Enterobacter cloacae complex TaxID=354276 RepID=UPI000445499A|nr:MULTISPECIES: hypothetical protein [Enterobacter cloacae complex]EUM54493.1 hypothetical protein L361_02521 [Enterobacter sp. MGH 15]MBU8927298.1 hypothetical protein [Enterobacter hormaechei]
MQKENLSDGLNDIFSDIVNEESLNLPFTVESDIISDFKEKCQIYFNLLNDYTENNDTELSRRISRRLEKIGEIYFGLVDSLSDFLSGDIKSAYDSFDRTFSDSATSRYIHHISTPLNKICNESKPLFRVRKSDTSIKDRKEMFHIPFSMRHLVNAQRYSVAGLPCLYLGSSLYVCWLEMDKPDFDKLYISSYSSDEEDSKILDFTAEILYSRFYGIVDDDEMPYLTKMSYICLMPLIYACNFRKKNNSTSFTQEYIIPNLLMQWISRRAKSNIVGIAYRSTKMVKTNSGDKSINVVLPPKVTYQQTISKDFCPKLIKMFKLTPPVSWQVLKTLDYTCEPSEGDRVKSASRFLRRTERLSGITNFDDSIVHLYPLTDFYKLEKCMDNLLEYDIIKDKK